MSLDKLNSEITRLNQDWIIWNNIPIFRIFIVPRIKKKIIKKILERDTLFKKLRAEMRKDHPEKLIGGDYPDRLHND